ncbi:aldo/keto reductase [Paenibacillus alginolyticus]|uniref:Aldo/keto reductase n=1 Tax=Paenibacillus alginolyticus TaxID=59839 RepID=A0ABT4GG42_9BACL|nr:aldo/keto reductase [Paenibacillus alginolyticus]MCY9695159.1 aldo/keto reductase [Paenibacillus alginolyticus]MEC0148273.1 aldo/keto reductase [Paenibacillus alginolyticus]
MKYRQLGDTELRISEVSFGTWAIGGGWGHANDDEALKGLHLAMEAGVNFFDTADVYGNGHAEELLAKATKGKENEIHVATKFCRAGDIHDLRTYSEESVRQYCESSLKRLKRERIDLYQIHCPPLSILKDGQVFEVLDKLKTEGKIRHYGVSVETVEEGLFSIGIPGVKALQVIYNLFRQKPSEELFPLAKAAGVGILVRLPLASGLLTGKFTESSTFAADDHRSFNADGAQFNVDETFAGLPFNKGVELARELAWIAEGRGNMARASMRWILDNPNITCVIPGFKNERQVEDNLGTVHVPSFTLDELERIQSFYQDKVKDHIRGPY